MRVSAFTLQLVGVQTSASVSGSIAQVTIRIVETDEGRIEEPVSPH